jgi:hypothetical protein
LLCISCGARLSDTAAPYPDQFLHSSGQIANFEKPYRGEYPADELSIVKEFPAIYD